MLFSLFLVCSTTLLVATGPTPAVRPSPAPRLAPARHRRLRPGGDRLGQLAALTWSLPPGLVEWGEGLVFAVSILVVLLRRDWNPVGQAFFGAFLTAAGVYLAFALYVTFWTGLSLPATAASVLLFLFEFAALTLASSFAFESLDVTTRVRWPRPIPEPDRPTGRSCRCRSARTTSLPTC